MLSHVVSFGIEGIEAYPVRIEVDVARGLPSITIVGLPDNAVKESKDRVRAAIKNSGFQFASNRIIINLSPADTKKSGASYDLAVALGYLAATGQICSESLKKFIILGELSLDGTLRPIHGALPISLSIPAKAFEGVILPQENAYEAAIAGRCPVFPARHLKEIAAFLSGSPSTLTRFTINSATLLNDHPADHADFSDVRGQALIKRGLEVAAAGGHNVLMIGPPGSGKTMLARRLPSILPPMALEEALEITKIHSVAGILPSQTALLTARPFRSPHHTSSDIALIGGGSHPKPGEVTLAHHGILFLDELPEFSRRVLEALRQPLEDGWVTVSRATKTIRFPSQCMLVASLNPCPCGYATDPRRECGCSPLQIQRYMSKISGPLLDRIDLHLEVAHLPTDHLMSLDPGEPSSAIRARTCAARRIQHERFAQDQIPVFANAFMRHRQIRQHCALSSTSQHLLKNAIDQLGLSARAHDKILKVARTIADLAGSAEIREGHLAEAIQYRCLDRT